MRSWAWLILVVMALVFSLFASSVFTFFYSGVSELASHLHAYLELPIEFSKSFAVLKFCQTMRSR